MNNKILKTSAVLALGTLLLVPSTKNVYATSTNTEANESVKTAEDEFNETLEKVNTKIVEYDAFMQGYEYQNSDQNLQLKFTNALDGLKKVEQELQNETITDENLFSHYTKTLNTSLDIIEEAKANLNGREVDRTELINLTTEQSEFRKSEAYQNAPKELKDKYDSAVDYAWKTLGENGLNLTNLQNELAISALEEAKKEIITNDQRTKALASLREEIAKINAINNDKNLYTERSYNNYNNAAILAKSTIENPNSTLDEIKSAKDLVESARKNLAKKQTASDISREEQIKRLEEAIKENNETRRAAELVKELSPNIAAKNIDYLNKLINNSKNIVSRSTKVLNQLKGIRG